MKKTLFTLMLMLASVLAVNAQSLTGKDWCTMIPDKDGTKVALQMTFDRNGTCEVELVAVQDMSESGMKMSIGMEVDIPGTYKLDDKNLKMKLNKEMSKVDIDIDIDGVDDQTEAMMKSMLKPEIEKGKDEVKKELLNVVPDLENMKIVSLDNNRLVLADSTGAEMEFYAKQD
ncbi:MAG: hypothetical protein IJR20_06705 [Muribaculaceae bacterium]|nr:hypothetical protein [Muribaculaceae bacterium]